MSLSAKRIRLVMWKEFLQLRRDPLLMRIILLMPVMQLVLFGYVVAVDVKHLPTAIIDLDRSTVSRQVDAAFGASDYFAVVAHPASETELRQMIDRGDVAVAIVIEEGTAARLARGEIAPLGIVVDGSDSSSASVGSGYAAQVVARINRQLLSASGAGAALSGAPGLDARIRVMYNPTLASLNSMIPGLVAVILMISLMVVMSQAVVRERESGTLEQMFVTPITPTEYLIGKVVPYLLLAIAQLTLVALVGILWFRVPFNGSPAVALTGLALFSLTALGLGLFVSLVSHTRQQAQQSILFLMMPFMILSGFIFPISSMPEAIKPLARAIPLTYVLEVLRGAAVKGAGFDALATPLLALAGFGVVILGGAVFATRLGMTE